MCNHCLPRFPLLSLSVSNFHQMPIPSNCRPRPESTPNFSLFTSLTPSYPSNSDSPAVKNGCIRSSFNKSSVVLGSEDNGFSAELKLKKNDENPFPLQSNRSEVDQTGGVEELSGGNINESMKPENLVPVDGTDGDDISKEDLTAMGTGKLGFSRGRQVLRRSSFLAKQVISITSALSLGFVSQLWVDPTTWIVMFVEVRSNLLSGDSECFLLEDVSQVGDVVLVEDESVIENEFKMVGMETLVGYKVVTPGQRNIGKVRGYTFNINSGVIESLELDSFGISIIPSSLVSTYALLSEDVLEVVSDTIVVHEAAALRIQRLTKGLLDGQNIGTSLDDLEEYSDLERVARSDKRSRISSGSQRFSPRKKSDDDWDFPMDYM